MTVADQPLVASNIVDRLPFDDGESDRRDQVVNILGIVGWTTRGLVYLVVAGIVVKVAWSGGVEPQQPTKTGVLRTLADRSGGLVLIALLGIGAIAYVLARLAPIVLYRTHTTWQQRGQAAAAAIVYLPLAYGAFRLLVGDSLRSGPAGDEGETNEIGSWLLQSRWGMAILVAGGLGLIGYAGYQAYKGVSGRFLRHLETDETPIPHGLVRAFGTAGFLARGVIALLLGGFALRAAASGDGSSVHSIDGALRQLIGSPVGVLALTAIAAGLAAFAGYCWCAAACRPHEDG